MTKKIILLYIRGLKTLPFRARMKNGRSVFRSKRTQALAYGASLFVIFCCVALSYAQKPSADEAIIGSTFKALAKAFAGMADLDQLKLNNVVKVKKMDEEKFRKRYAKVYPILMDLPQDIRAKYKIEEGMTKEQAVRNILILDQQKINAIIDAVPDRVIAAQFKLYLNKKAQDLQKINLAVEINKLWSGFIEKAFKK